MDTDFELELVEVKAKGRIKRRNALGPDEFGQFQEMRVEMDGGEGGSMKQEDSEKACLRDKTKNRLERLGALYRGEEISSPIHKSEANFSVEDDTKENSTHTNDKYCEERRKRFRALASTINSWEDDIRHIRPRVEEVEKFDRFGNKIGSKAVHHETVQTPGKESAPLSPSKKVMWDKKIINTLEQQGFKRCDSEEHLVYNYKTPTSNDCTTTPKKRGILKETAAPTGELPYKPGGNPSSPSKTGRNVPSPSKTPAPAPPVLPSPSHKPPAPSTEEVVKRNFHKINEKSNSYANRREEQGRPASPSKKSSAVLSMAAQFEGNRSADGRTASLDISKRDPALLSVAEKRAVFEKNRGFVPLPPSAAGPVATAPVVMKPVTPAAAAPVTPAAAAAVAAGTLQHSSSASSPQILRHNVNQAIVDRFKEIEELRSRWDTNKAVAAAKETGHEQEEEGGRDEATRGEKTASAWGGQFIPPAPPLPPPPGATPLSPPPSSSSSGGGGAGGGIRMGTRSPLRGTAGGGTGAQLLRTSPAAPPGYTSPPQEEDSKPYLPRILSIKEKSPKKGGGSYPGKVREVEISPPKPGHLYPSLSDLEPLSESSQSDLSPIEEEGDSMRDEEESRNNSSVDVSSALDTSSESFGQKIVRQASRNTLKRGSEDESMTESRVLQEMDDLLNEAMDDSPSPAKKSRQSSSDESTPAEPRTVQLIHTVSLYRKQQNFSTTPTIKRELRTVPDDFEMKSEYSETNLDESISEDTLVEDRIKELQIENTKQLEMISQASKALNLCQSTPGFAGSIQAEIEAQRLLLIANLRWTILNHEIERLKIEKKLRPSGKSRYEERGDISLSNVSLPLKRNSPTDANLCVLVVVKSGPLLVHSELIEMKKEHYREGKVAFQKIITLKNLYADFTATLEVYGYSPRKSDFSNGESSKCKTPGKKDKHKTTPKKHKDKIFLPVESPAGPNAVRSSGFQLWGYAVFSLSELDKKKLTLSKVPYTCPLDSSVHLQLTSCLKSLVSSGGASSPTGRHRGYSGFLTKFEDVSGFGAWKRRWASLCQGTLAFWVYPEDQQLGKVPVDSIDLTRVTTREAGLAPVDRCARPHTILLESKLADHSIPESLIARREGNHTIITHLLSADTKPDRLEWCHQLNQALKSLHTWKVTNT